MSEQTDDVKPLDITTVDQAMELVIQNFMNNAAWFAAGVKSSDIPQAARYILSHIASRLYASAAPEKDNKEGKPLC